MSQPKEEERVVPVAGLEPDSTSVAAPEGRPGRFGQDSAWHMPGGEDLLNFALSAGLATGLWWLEHRDGGPAGSPAAGDTVKEEVR
ncbi:MAG: hypothetical protein ACP5UT_13045 [Bryobacteraceae bacterium]